MRDVIPNYDNAIVSKVYYTVIQLDVRIKHRKKNESNVCAHRLVYYDLLCNTLVHRIHSTQF